MNLAKLILLLLRVLPLPSPPMTSLDLHLTALLPYLFPSSTSFARSRFFLLSSLTGLSYALLTPPLKNLLSQSPYFNAGVDLLFYLTCLLIFRSHLPILKGGKWVSNEWEDPTVTSSRRIMDPQTFSGGCGKVLGSLPPRPVEGGWEMAEVGTVQEGLEIAARIRMKEEGKGSGRRGKGRKDDRSKTKVRAGFLPDPTLPRFHPTVVPSNVQLQPPNDNDNDNDNPNYSSHFSRPIYTNVK